MHLKQTLAASAFIGVMMIGQSTQAGVIVTTYAGASNFGNGSVGYENGAVAPNPNSNTNLAGVGIGGDSFTSTNVTYDFSSTGQFNVWCVDIYHWMINGTVTYIVGTGGDLATELSALRPGTPNGAQRVSQLIKLADQVYSAVNTKAESAAFQLAVWAIAYGTADSLGVYHIDTSDPGFHVGSNTTVHSDFGVLANQWLANLNTAPVSNNYTLTYLNDGAREFTQDVVVFTPTRIPNAISEPISIALLGLGLVGLGIGRRQKF